MAKRRFTKEEVRQWREEHRGFGYFNKEDRNIFVSREFGIGWSPNWANPLCYLVIAVLIGIVIAIQMLVAK